MWSLYRSWTCMEVLALAPGSCTENHLRLLEAPALFMEIDNCDRLTSSLWLSHVVESCLLSASKNLK